MRAVAAPLLTLLAASLLAGCSMVRVAYENADSRVKAGLHFRFATEAGLELGRRIGNYVIGNALLRDDRAAPHD